MTVSLFWMAAAAVVAPLLGRLARGRAPEVVVLLLVGVLIGPHVLGLASTQGIEMIKQLGMGLLFLLAGMEIELKSLVGRQGRWAWTTWTVGFVVAVFFAWLITPDVDFTQAVALGLAISSTALGTLLPILKDRGLTDTPLGRAIFTHGAVGEIGPVVVMALLLTSHSPLQAGLLMGFFVLVTLAVIAVPTRLQRRVGLDPGQGSHLSPWSLRTLLRAVMLLLSGLMALAAILEFDAVLGRSRRGSSCRASADITCTRSPSRWSTWASASSSPCSSWPRGWRSRSPRSPSTRGCYSGWPWSSASRAACPSSSPSSSSTPARV